MSKILKADITNILQNHINTLNEMEKNCFSEYDCLLYSKCISILESLQIITMTGNNSDLQLLNKIDFLETNLNYFYRKYRYIV